jgi:hypothetical protein
MRSHIAARVERFGSSCSAMKALTGSSMVSPPLF